MSDLSTSRFLRASLGSMESPRVTQPRRISHACFGSDEQNAYGTREVGLIWLMSCNVFGFVAPILDQVVVITNPFMLAIEDTSHARAH